MTIKWIYVHLRELAHIKIHYLRTNKWPADSHFSRNSCLTHFCVIVIVVVFYRDRGDKRRLIYIGENRFNSKKQNIIDDVACIQTYYIQQQFVTDTHKGAFKHIIYT